jgi:hypothetical protein
MFGWWALPIPAVAVVIALIRDCRKKNKSRDDQND